MDRSKYISYVAATHKSTAGYVSTYSHGKKRSREKFKLKGEKYAKQ